MSLTYGPSVLNIPIQSSSQITITTWDDKSVSLASPVVLGAHNDITFTVSSAGRYKIIIKTPYLESVYTTTLSADNYDPSDPRQYVDSKVADLQRQIDDGGGEGAVASVNGQTGVVVIDADDVSALPAISVDGTYGVEVLLGGTVGGPGVIFYSGDINQEDPVSVISPTSISGYNIQAQKLLGVPVLTTAQLLDIAEGHIAYDSDRHALVEKSDTGWKVLADKTYVDDGLAAKITHVNGTPAVYARDASGGVVFLSWASAAATASTIARRTADGVIKTATPLVDADAATKKYVDAAIAAALENYISGDGSITQMVKKTQAEYDGLTPVETTHYDIVG